MLAYNESWRWSSSIFFCFLLLQKFLRQEAKMATKRKVEQFSRYSELSNRDFLWLRARAEMMYLLASAVSDCAWKREKSWKHNEVEETNGKKFNRSRFGLFHQHGIHLIHSFVLCKFEPLPCWTRSRLHREELIGDQASLVAYMLLRCWCGHQEASSAKNKPESVHSNPKNHDKVFNLKANKTASTIKVKQIKLQ